MEVFTASTAHLFGTLNQLRSSSFIDSLPQSLPVQPCVPMGKNSSQIPISDPYYFSIFFIFGGGLYLLLLFPFTLRQKQWMAAPLTVALFTLPLIFTTVNSATFQLIHIAACACVFMRMFDLYYVTPWRTGKEPTMNLEDWWSEIWKPFRKIPMSKDQLQRFELELQQSRLRRDLERREREEKKAKANNKDNSNDSNNNDTKNSPTNEHHDNDTSKNESSADVKPIRGKQRRQIYTPPMDPNPQHWSVYLPRWIFYAVMMDIIAFSISFITFEQIDSLSFLPKSLITIAVGAMVIFDISLGNYTLMIIWATLTGDLIRDTEWTLVRHYFPGLATSPAEFWRQWHHLFQYIWVDLGFKPVHHLLRKHVTGKTSNRALARAIELVLPVMGVFLMSGIMHEQLMVGMFHVTPGHMTAFFLIQGAGTIVSKALQNTVGQKVTVPPVILIALTWVFNLSTASLFMEPVLKNHGYNLVAHQSVLLHAYNFLRANGVF